MSKKTSKPKRQKETIRLYFSEDANLLYFIKNGKEIGYIDLTGHDDEIAISDIPETEEWHATHKLFVGEL